MVRVLGFHVAAVFSSLLEDLNQEKLNILMLGELEEIEESLGRDGEEEKVEGKKRSFNRFRRHVGLNLKGYKAG